MATVTFNQATNMDLLPSSLIGSNANGGAGETDVEGLNGSAYCVGNLVVNATTLEVSGTVTRVMIDTSDDGAFANLDITSASFFMDEAYWSSTFTRGNLFDLVARLLAGNDTLLGSAGNDWMLGFSGNDTLLGGAGADTLDGGAGSNTASYATANTGIVASLANAAMNTGQAAGDRYLAIQNLTGSAFADVLTGDTGVNSLDGGAGNDVLDGGASTDMLRGGSGNDTYVLANSSDVVIDTGGTADTITSTIMRSLGSYSGVERLILTGTAAVSGYGNAAANTLVGNVAANVLSGGGGNDTLIGGNGVDRLAGGAGYDSFLFNARLSSANRDLITDFNPAFDVVRLDNAVMTGLGAVGMLRSYQFFAGSAAHDANDRIIYNKATGALLYDANGSAAGGVTQLATLTSRPTLTVADFVVI